jgi:hypothetical protein
VQFVVHNNVFQRTEYQATLPTSSVTRLGKISPFVPGLPDGIFSNQKSQIGYILKGRGMVYVGRFYGCLEYYKVIWQMLWSFGMYILWLFGIFYGHLVN